MIIFNKVQFDHQRGSLMKFTYLGTASSEGWPSIFCRCPSCEKARVLKGKNTRSRSQAIIDDTILLDLPCDTFLHALNGTADISKVKYILITHSHTDHFYPAELRLRCAPYSHDLLHGKITLICNKKAYLLYEQILSRSNAKKSALDSITVKTISDFSTLYLDGYKVVALPARHIDGENAFLYYIEKNGKSLLYAHDTGYFFDDTFEFLRGLHLDFLSLDCTFGLNEPTHNGHMCLKDNLLLKKRLEDMGITDDKTKIYLNHFSHNINLSHEELESAVAPHFSISHDGLTIQI